MRKMKILTAVLALIMAFSLLSACANEEIDGDVTGTDKLTSPSESSDPSETEVSSSYKDTITHGIADVIPGVFNPVIATKSTDQDVNILIYPALFEVTPEGTQVPYLAKSYEVSDDNKSFVFKLNEDAVWQDGEPVTADDVAFTFSSILAPDYPGTSYGRFKTILGAEDYHNGVTDSVEGIRVLDSHTIEIEFALPSSPNFSNMVKMGIIPEHIWGQHDVTDWENQTELLSNPIGCGPYKMVDFVEGQYIALEAFDKFFGGEVMTKNMVIKITTPDSILAELRNGTIDVVSVRDLTVADLDILKEQLGFETVPFANNMYRYVSMNMRQDVFKSLELRQALNYAIDRQLIVDTILEGRGVLINAPFSPNGWATPDETNMNQYGYDPDKAIELLQSAGYEDRDGDGIVEDADGNSLSFTYKIPTDSQISEQVAVFLQESWKAIGVDVEILSFDYSTLAQQAIYEHDFDLYTLNCQFTLDPNLHSWWHSVNANDEPGVGSFNFGAFKNERVDELIDLDVVSMDQDERITFNQEIAEIISSEAPMVFLYVQDNEMAYHSGLEGYAPSTFNIFYNVHNWTIAE